MRGAEIESEADVKVSGSREHREKERSRNQINGRGIGETVLLLPPRRLCANPSLMLTSAHSRFPNDNVKRGKDDGIRFSF